MISVLIERAKCRHHEQVPTSKGEITQEKILKAGKKLIAKEGIEQASFQKIADACGLSQSAVMHHFPNKDTLLQSVIKSIVENNQRTVHTITKIEDDARTQLLKHFYGNLDWAVTHVDEARIIISIYYLATFKPKFSKLYALLLHNAQEKIRALLLAGQREGNFKFSSSPEGLAALLHDTLLGGIINLITTKTSKSSVQNKRNEWRRFIDRVSGYHQISSGPDTD